MKKISLIVIFVIFASSLVSAAFNFHSNGSRIDSAYLEGEIIRGKINMSFDNHRDSNFTSSLNGSMRLYDVLKKMGLVAGKDFFCDPISCKNFFSAESGSETSSKVISLENEKLVGFKILGGNFEGFEKFRFEIEGLGVGAHCKSQIGIDLLSDGVIEYRNSNYTTESCGPQNFGCFTNSGGQITQGVVQKNRAYCERINLTAAPAYKLGAKVEHISGRPGELEFLLFDYATLNDLGYKSSTAVDGNDINVVVEYASDVDFEAIVCVRDKAYEGTANYKIRVRNSNDICGGQIENQGGYRDQADYEIYAQPLKYAVVPRLVYDGSAQLRDLNNYVNRTYGSDCRAPDGCVIPIRLSSKTGVLSQYRIENIEINYQSGVSLASENRIYEIRDESFKINTSAILLDVGKMNFEVPAKNGNHEFVLYFDGREIIEEEINVKVGSAFDMQPRFALIGRETLFRIVSNSSITQSRWIFGDGSQATASGNSVTHVYSSAGNYTIEITTGLGSNTSTRKFDITVGDPRKSANLTVIDYENRLRNVRNSLNEMPSWISNEIKKQLSIEDKEEVIKNSRLELEGARVDEDFVEVINDLLSVDMPHDVYISDRGEIPLVAFYESLDPKYARKLSGVREDYSLSDSEIKINILDWSEKNFDVTIDFETYSTLERDQNVALVTKYDVSLQEKNEIDEAFFVIDRPIEDIVFDKNDYDEHDIDSGTYLVIEGGVPNNVQFLVSGSGSDYPNLGLHLAPNIARTFVEDKPFATNLYDEEGNFRWGFFLIGIAMVLLATLVVYVILQSWYKRYYEKHLFKNPDDLYNIINFIYNSRRSELVDSDIRKKLMEKKWDGEQITYAFKKIDGKRTGMWEIPVFKFLENKKVAKEIEKKQHSPVDARFIKRA